MNDEYFAKENISNYLRKYKKVFLVDDVEQLIDKIYNQALKNGYSDEDIFSGRYDDYIMLNIKNMGNGIHLTEDFAEILEYVNVYVDNSVKKIINDKNILNNTKFKIAMDLTAKTRKLEYVKNGLYDELIDRALLKAKIKLKSVVLANYPDLAPVKKSNTLMSKKTKERILVLVITMMVTAGIAISSSIIEKNKEDEIFITIEQIDPYEYPTIYYSMSNEFDDTTNNILKRYNDYAKYGENYGQIALFRAYESITSKAYENEMSEKLHCMDVMFDILEYQSNIDDDNNPELYEVTSSNTCYVTYVYDELIKAGIDTISSPKFKHAVSEYDSQVCNYKQLKPYKLISSESQSTIKKMMKIYEKYMKDLSNEFENVITDEYDGKSK